MSVASPAEWQDLFIAGDLSNPESVVQFRVVQRFGEPFLVLPLESRLAAQALEMYAAQTFRGRLAKLGLGLALKFNLPLRCARVSLAVERDEPFATFLKESAGTSGFPKFAILLGNPRAEGRRFMLLLFDDAGRAVAVVKAGADDEARRLIAHEADFLESWPEDVPGAPRLLGRFDYSHVRALAVDFVIARSPDPEDQAGVEKMLSPWVDPKRRVKFHELPAWERLTAGAGLHLAGWSLWRELDQAECHPAVYHGDFAPWNLKVMADGWLALDWERGEMAGVPGWDWFHFVTQHALLVRRERVEGMEERIEQLLASEHFVRYAILARIKGIERQLFVAYLNYSIQVLRQQEELPRLQSLLNRLAQKWPSKP